MCSKNELEQRYTGLLGKNAFWEVETHYAGIHLILN